MKFIVDGIVAIGAFLVSWFTKKTAIGLAMITTYGVLTTGFVAAIMMAIAAAKASAIGFGGLPGAVVQGMSYFTPDNLGLCLGLALAGKTQATAYLWSVANLKMLSVS